MLYARSGLITIGLDVINRLILVLYFPEFTLKLFERTEALMLVSVAQVYNPLSFWLPPDTGTANYDDVPEAMCGICGCFYKADEPDDHECEGPEIECDICGHISTDHEGRHHCCEDNSNE